MLMPARSRRFRPAVPIASLSKSAISSSIAVGLFDRRVGALASARILFLASTMSSFMLVPPRSMPTRICWLLGADLDPLRGPFACAAIKHLLRRDGPLNSAHQILLRRGE